MRAFIIVLAAMLSTQVEAKEYRLKEIVRMYVDYAPELRAAKSQFMASHYDAKAATAKFFPNVSLNGSVSEYRNPSLNSSPLVPLTGKQYKGSIDVVQPIFAGGALWRGMEVAQLSKALQEQTYLNTKQESISSIIQAALQLGSLADQIKVLEESQKYQERFYNLTKNKASRGAAKNYELNQARADYLSYAPRLESTRQQFRDAEERLRVRLGLDKNQAIEVGVPIPSKVESLNFEKLLEQAAANRPTVKMAQINVELAGESKWLNLSEDLPSISLIGSFGYQSPTQEDFNKDTTKFHSVGVTLKIPLFSGLSSIHKYKSGQENIRLAEENLASTRNSLREEVKQAIETIQSAQTQFNSSAEWATEARKALNSSIDSYRIGVISSVQVIQVQKGWEAAETSLLNARLGYQTTLLNLRKIIGTDLEKVYTEN